MKKNLLTLSFMLLLAIAGYSQATFSTGGVRFDVDEYGAMEIYSAADVVQLDRASILVGTSATAVFDYKNDAEQNEPTVLVASPTMSDFEIYGAYDNTYSNDPPEVIVKLNAYGWTNQKFVIVKFNVKNNSLLPFDATTGLDIIPYLNSEWGFDTVTYNAAQNVIRFHREVTTNMGIKLLSAPLTSLYSFEWYSGYSVDADYWDWMNKGTLQPEFVGMVDGPVAITAQAPKTLAAGASYDVYYAFALGANETEMLANMEAAQLKYNILTTSVKETPLAGTGLKNYPNPVNSTTTFSYQTPIDGNVSLKIYNVMGVEVAEVLNKSQAAGLHTVDFDASNLAAGAYTYKLKLNNQVVTNKMFVVK